MPIKQLPLAMRLLQGPSLVNDHGEGYTPSAIPGLAGGEVREWGYQQALKNRTDNTRKFWENRGKPGSGFLPPAHATPLPNEWEIMGNVVRGRQNAIESVGGRARMPEQQDYYNDPSPNTRWDERQIGLATGNTLADDTSGYDQATNKISRPTYSALASLRRRFGL